MAAMLVNSIMRKPNIKAQLIHYEGLPYNFAISSVIGKVKRQRIKKALSFINYWRFAFFSRKGFTWKM